MIQVGFKVLNERISKENVAPMSELLALIGTKLQIGFMGYPAERTYKKLYVDLLKKNEEGYVLSDGYDIVQEIALFLTTNYGKSLNDIYYVSKKGKSYSIKMTCYKIATKVLGEKYRRYKDNTPLEDVELKVEMEEPIDKEELYKKVDGIISRLNLSETHLTVLSYRMSGASFPKIGKIINRSSSTAYDYLQTVRRRYEKYI